MSESNAEFLARMKRTRAMFSDWTFLSEDDATRWFALAEERVMLEEHRLSCMAAPMAGWIVHGGQDETFTQESSTDFSAAIHAVVDRIKEGK